MNVAEQTVNDCCKTKLWREFLYLLMVLIICTFAWSPGKDGDYGEEEEEEACPHESGCDQPVRHVAVFANAIQTFPFCCLVLRVLSLSISFFLFQQRY